ETSALAERRAVLDPRVFLREMRSSPLIALIATVLIVSMRMRSLTVAAPLLTAWFAAPWLAYVLSRPVPTKRPALDEEDRRFLEQVARDTWRYFDTYVTAQDHFLAPDNVQMVPSVVVAHRSSPTNIGMALLSILAAHDFGWIGDDDLATRLDQTLTTIEGLERYAGHL